MKAIFICLITRRQINWLQLLNLKCHIGQKHLPSAVWRVSPSPSFSMFMKGLSFFSNKTAVSVWFLLSARHVISSRIICTHKHTKSVSSNFQLPFCLSLHRASLCFFSFIITPPEASPAPSSRLRRSRGCRHVLSGPEPMRLVYVKQLPSGSQSLCSPGCPLRFPVRLDDA